METRNEGWGFWGGMEANAAEAWPLAISAIAGATGQPDETVRDFLDSRHGRHFADDVKNEMAGGLSMAAAVTSATERWMTWRINRRTSKEQGIPAKLPYLLGHVIQAGINAEAM